MKESKISQKKLQKSNISALKTFYHFLSEGPDKTTTTNSRVLDQNCDFFRLSANL